MRKNNLNFFESNDGLKIAYAEFGDPDGKPLFFFHGSPGSRLEAKHLHEPAINYGYRIIAPDRPGMGESDYEKDRTWLDYPDDIIELAEHLDIGSFGAIGVSGGGLALFSCAYKIPEHMEFAVGVGVWAPNINGQLYEHLAPIDRFFSRLTRVPSIFRITYKILGFIVKRQSGKKLMMNFESSMCEADLEIVKNDDDMVEFLAKDIKEAFKQGSKGPALDALLQYRDWGFDLREITIPVHLYHGTADKFVPFPFSGELNRILPNSTLKKYPNQRHYSIMDKFDKIFQEIETRYNKGI